MVIPKWLNAYINEKDIVALESRIADIESRCDVEIVPVIVRASSVYPQTKITASLVALIFFIELSSILNIQWGWDNGWMALIFGLSVLLTLFIFVPWLSSIPRIQRLLAHRDVEMEQCWKRADIEFYSGRVTQTKRDNGLLIFISVLEHCVIVKGDRSIVDKLGTEVWGAAVNAIVSSTKQKKMAQGIEKALHEMESLLSMHFPVTSGKENEIPNTFIIKE